MNPTTPHQRHEILNATVARQCAKGWRVESQNDSQAMLVKGHRHSHLLHLVLTVLTFGAWLLVWVPLAMFGGEKRWQVVVDPFGQVTITTASA